MRHWALFFAAALASAQNPPAVRNGPVETRAFRGDLASQLKSAPAMRNPEVRKQAFFWLGQTHDPRAMAFFEDVLTK